MFLRKVNEKMVDPVLVQKVDDTIQQLAETVKKDEGGSVTWAMASQDFREQVTGGNTAVVGVNAVLEENVTDGAISPKKTTFFNLSKNLFDKSKVVEGIVSESTGAVSAHASYQTSDFTPVTGGASYTLTRAYRFAFYDVNKVFISGLLVVDTNPYTVVAPANAAFIRFSISKTSGNINTFMFVAGTTLPTIYEAFGAAFIPKEKVEQTPIVNLSRSNLGDEFTLNADIPNGTDLNTLTKEGTYTGVANGGYINKPVDLDAGRAFTLTVTPVYKGGLRWYIQRITDFTEVNKKYARKVDKVGTGTTAWIVDATPKRFPDLVSGTDMNTVLAEGRYLGVGTNTYTNIPPALAGKSFYLVVNDFGYASGQFKKQEFSEFQNPSVIYHREIINGTPKEFVKLDVTASSKPLAGKKAVMLGDSITEFGNYPQIAGERTGLITYNCGFGGTRMAHHVNADYDKFSATKLVDALISRDFSAQEAANATTGYTTTFDTLKSIDLNTIDYLTFFYGTNDYRGALSVTVPLGVSTDYGSATFKGAINYIIDRILTAYPHLKIAFITPMWRMNSVTGGGDSDINPNDAGVYLIEYVDAVIERANAHHIPALDLYRNGSINKYNKTTFLADDTHPNTAGYALVGGKIGGFLNTNF